MLQPLCHVHRLLINGSVEFDGVDDRIQLSGADDELDIQGAISICGWIKYSGTADGFIFGAYGGGPGFEGYGLALDSGGLLSWYNSGSNSWLDGFVALDDDNWHHVAVANEGTDCSLYVDGKPNRVVTTIADPDDSYSGIRYIGVHAHGTTGPFTGEMCDFRIYDRKLTDDDVWRIFAGLDDPAILPDANRVGSWRLDEGTGTTATDADSGNDGVLQNGVAWSSLKPGNLS